MDSTENKNEEMINELKSALVKRVESLNDAESIILGATMASNKVMGDEVNEIDKKLIISWINEFAGGNILATISGLMEVFGMVEGIVSYSLFIEHISSSK